MTSMRRFGVRSGRRRSASSSARSSAVSGVATKGPNPTHRAGHHSLFADSRGRAYAGAGPRNVPPRVEIEGLGVRTPGPALELEIAVFERARELELVDAALARARSGRGAFVILDGLPGSGRTRTLSLAAE